MKHGKTSFVSKVLVWFYLQVDPLGVEAAEVLRRQSFNKTLNPQVNKTLNPQVN